MTGQWHPPGPTLTYSTGQMHLHKVHLQPHPGPLKILQMCSVVGIMAFLAASFLLTEHTINYAQLRSHDIVSSPEG